MKRFIPVLVLLSLSFNAFADYSLNCQQIYTKVIQSKWDKKDRANRQSGVLGLAGVPVAAISPITGTAMIVVAFGLSAYADLPTKEERTLRLADEGTREVRWFTRSLKRSISPQITEDEVVAIVNSGLESGLYCDNFPKLADKRDIRHHVRKVLKAKYRP